MTDKVRFDCTYGVNYGVNFSKPQWAAIIKPEPKEPNKWLKMLNSNTKQAKSIRLFIVALGISTYIILKG